MATKQDLAEWALLDGEDPSGVANRLYLDHDATERCAVLPGWHAEIDRDEQRFEDALSGINAALLMVAGIDHRRCETPCSARVFVWRVGLRLDPETRCVETVRLYVAAYKIKVSPVRLS